jgi:hypothetical protein
MQPPPEKPFGRLEVLCSAGAVCLAIGTFLGLWPFNLPLALILLAVVYWALRDLRSMSRLKNASIAPQRSRNVHAERTDQASH